MLQKAGTLRCGIKGAEQIGTVRRIAQVLAKGMQGRAKFGQILAQGAAQRRRERTGVVLAKVLDTLDERTMLAEGVIHQVPKYLSHAPPSIVGDMPIPLAINVILLFCRAKN